MNEIYALDPADQKCLIIVGPSGSGKSTLEKTLSQKFPYNFYKTISFTTRPPRDGEIHGFDYYFLNQAEFDKTEKVEHITFGNNHYGLALTEFTEKPDKRNIICVVEPTGAAQIISYLKMNMTWITPVLIYMDIDKRVRIKNMSTGRGDEDKAIKLRLQHDDIQERFMNAKLWEHVDHYKRITKLHEDMYIEVLNLIKAL